MTDRRGNIQVRDPQSLEVLKETHQSESIVNVSAVNEDSWVSISEDSKIIIQSSKYSYDTVTETQHYNEI
jgi:hypothetical protein